MADSCILASQADDAGGDGGDGGGGHDDDDDNDPAGPGVNLMPLGSLQMPQPVACPTVPPMLSMMTQMASSSSQSSPMLDMQMMMMMQQQQQQQWMQLMLQREHANHAMAHQRFMLEHVVKKEVPVKLEPKKEPEQVKQVKLEGVFFKKEKGRVAKREKMKFEDLGGGVSIERPPSPIRMKVLDSDDESAEIGENIVMSPGQNLAIAVDDRRAPKNQKISLVAAPRCNRKVKINVVSVGWHQQGCRYDQDFKKIVDDLDKRMKFRFKTFKADLLIDCRSFFNWPGTGHCGRNTQDIQAVLDHPKYDLWLQRFKPKFEECLDYETDRFYELTVAMVCKAGVNRSVSCAEVMYGVFEDCGYEVTLQHLSMPSWQNKRWKDGKQVCSWCEDCMKSTTHESHAVRMQLRKKALTTWRA